MTRTALLPALLLSLTLITAGCGDDTRGDGETKAEPLTKAEFTTKADKICADGSAELQASAKKLGENPSEEEAGSFVSDSLVPNIQAQHDDLAQLRPPEGDEAKVEDLLASLQQAIDSLEDDPKSMLTGQPFAEANDLAESYGLEKCAA